MLNLCTVALQLCDSFLLSKGKGKYKQIEPQYCTSKGCRLRFDNERTMAGGHIGKLTPLKRVKLSNFNPIGSRTVIIFIVADEVWLTQKKYSTLKAIMIFCSVV